LVFSSVLFIVYFLPLFLAAYYASGLRTAVLLTGSVLFYVWGEGAYVLLLVSLIAANHIAAHRIKDAGSLAKYWLIGCIALDLGVFGVFKYSGFVASNLNHLFGRPWLGERQLKLPLGISFFTFQLISYLTDVYRGHVQPERKPLAFATYILMFPHLIAGPIVRYATISDELRPEGRHLRLGLGVQYFIVGLCQKVLIANTLAPIADQAFGMAQGTLTAGTAWLGLLAYTLQIYFDFCGYSNMAIGLAFMMGFTFPKNFDYPYAASSITDFWRRWHMSLSFWFRDYVYIPLGGNQHGRMNTLRNLLIVFLLTGLWHGAAWNFIFWGLFHGSFLLLERIGLDRVLQRLPRAMATGYALLVVMVGWVFFRAGNFGHALSYLHSMLHPQLAARLPMDMLALLTPEVRAALLLGILFSFPLWPNVLDRIGQPRLARSPQILEARMDTLQVHLIPVAGLLLGFALSCALLASSTLNPFLYFRF
jgi:alginate O-acetyltransferase complex protein AlgI